MLAYYKEMHQYSKIDRQNAKFLLAKSFLVHAHLACPRPCHKLFENSKKN